MPVSHGDLRWVRWRTGGSWHVLKHRSYLTYSIACFLVWAILIALTGARAKNGRFHDVVLVFAGWTLCWVSATIARSVYPPPKRWLPKGEEPAP
jgi:hypothetical protein